MRTLQEISTEIVKEIQSIEYIAMDTVVSDSVDDDTSVEAKALKKYEPMRSYRWKLEIEGLDPFLMKSISNLSYSRETSPYYSSDGYVSNYASNYMATQPLQVQIYDAEDPSSARQIMDWVENGENFTKRDGTLYQYDSKGDVARKWYIKGMMPIEVVFGSLDYGSDEPGIIDVKFMVDTYMLD